MSRIPQTFLDDLLQRVDIVELVDHRVKLRRSGKNYSACCPFHEEKTPSFTVSPEKQFYYCFGCGATGTAISFLMEYDHLNFIDAVESLAKTAGVEVPKETTPRDDAREQLRKRCYNTLENAATYFSEQLKTHPQKIHAVKYLQQRGLSGQIAKAYGMGYAPPGWDNLLLRLGQNESDQQTLIDTGLVIDRAEENKRYDRFRHRIMFPIRDGRGRVIAFGGRVLGDDKPKYLNSPETEVFQKGRELYGLHEARKFGKKLDFLIVVEGYMDVIALAQYGMWNAVATLGTACGEDHLKLAFRHVNEVVFCFDGDRAGRAAAKRALLNSLTSMEDGRQIRFLFLPDGQDPDSLVRQIGAERFTAQIQNAMPMEEFLFDMAADGIDLNSMDGRARFSKLAAPLIQQLPEGIYQSLMMDNLAKRTGLSTQALAQFTQIDENLLIETANEAEQIPAPTDSDHSHTPYPEQTPNPEYSPSRLGIRRNKAIEVHPARRAMVILLENPSLFKDVEHTLDVPEVMKEDADNKNLVELVSYLTRRPNANVSNIIGYWGGALGVAAQQALAKHIANHVFGEHKHLRDYFDLLKELNSCIESLNTEGRKLLNKEELAALTAKGLDQLNNEEKQRYLTLIQSS